MKLCPQCHFTFDDQERVCDFDGSELTPVADPAPLSDRIVSPARKLNLLRFLNVRTALVGLVCVLLALGTFLIVRHGPSSSATASRPVWTAERSDAIAKAAPTRKPRRRIAYAHKRAHRSHATIARTSTPRRVSAPTPTATRYTTTTTPTRYPPRMESSRTEFSKQTVAMSEKKDSTVSVVFKKTGTAFKKTFSFLKKPFGL